jgi:endo-1,4-beta-xylanase
LDTTLNHLKGKIYVYDVCNETLIQGPYNRGPAYDTNHFLWKVFQQDTEVESGFEYFKYTFNRARRLDPSAKLIYLDYSQEIICNKSDQMYLMMKNLLLQKIPIDGVGFQMHLTADDKISHNPYEDIEYFESFRENLQRFNDLGLEIWVTEFDVKLDEFKYAIQLEMRGYF